VLLDIFLFQQMLIDEQSTSFRTIKREWVFEVTLSLPFIFHIRMVREGRTLVQAVEKGQKLGQIAFISKNLSMSEGLIKV
jgi:hypothetical protein